MTRSVVSACNRYCGACCQGNPYTGADEPCPHLSRDASGMYSCEVYDKLPRPCGDDGNYPYDNETAASFPYCTVRFSE